VAVGGISELFVNVPAYGIAYSRSPKNMRGLVSAINLFSTAIAYALGLACSEIVRDPYLTWVFAIPTVIGAIAVPIFWLLFKHIDAEEYTLTSEDETHGESQTIEQTGTKVEPKHP
jgi:dipeptide/tripeptide permease